MSRPRPLDQKSLARGLARFEALATGPDGLRWLELLHRLKSGDTAAPDEIAMVDELVDLEICQRGSAGVSLTAFGSKCADSAREYLFWTQRGRKLPHQGVPPMLLESFRDKDVLEIGPGWGCNLLPLATVARRAVGLEIEPVYAGFSRIFAKREAVARPQISLGTVEDIPFGGAEFDWVLMVSVLQYTDVQVAFREVHRVLRPGGLLLAIQGLLPQLASARLRDVIRNRNPRLLLPLASIAANTLWYQCFGRRLRENVEGDSTARPIYPTRTYLKTASAKAGLHLRADLSTPVGNDFALVFQNEPGASGSSRAMRNHAPRRRPMTLPSVDDRTS